MLVVAQKEKAKQGLIEEAEKHKCKKATLNLFFPLSGNFTRAVKWLIVIISSF